MNKYKMEITSEPELYTPGINNMGNYIDSIPSFNNIKNGIQCPCGSRKGKIYNTHTIFSAHIKTNCHKKWLENLNLNKANYYVENEQLKNIIKNQKMIIAQLDIDIQNKNMTIDYLTQQLVNGSKFQQSTTDLLLFD